MKSNDDSILEAKIDGISKGLRMGMAYIYGELLSFDKQNIENDNPSVALAFLQQQASDLGHDFGEFMDDQTKLLEEYYEYRDAINNVYKVAEKYGYKEEK